MSSGQSSKAEFAAVSAGKRRKTSNTATSSFPSLDIQNLTHLPSDQLVHIAGYLSKTSRALFATALTAPPSSWRRLGWKGSPSDASKAVTSVFTTCPLLIYNKHYHQHGLLQPAMPPP